MKMTPYSARETLVPAGALSKFIVYILHYILHITYAPVVPWYRFFVSIKWKCLCIWDAPPFGSRSQTMNGNRYSGWLLTTLLNLHRKYR